MKASPKKYQAAYNYAIAVESQDPQNYDANIANWDKFISVAKKNPKAKAQVATAQNHVKKLKDAKAQAALQ